MPATRLKIFISSVQKEFEEVRRELKQLVRLGVLEKVGDTGRRTHYTIVKNKPVFWIFWGWKNSS